MNPVDYSAVVLQQRTTEEHWLDFPDPEPGPAYFPWAPPHSFSDYYVIRVTVSRTLGSLGELIKTDWLMYLSHIGPGGLVAVTNHDKSVVSQANLEPVAEMFSILGWDMPS